MQELCTKPPKRFVEIVKERGLETTLEMPPSDPVPVPSAEVKEPQPAKDVSNQPTEAAALSTEEASGSPGDTVKDGDSKTEKVESLDKKPPNIKDTPNHRPSVLHGLPVASPKEQVKGVGAESGKGPGEKGPGKKGKGRGKGKGKGRGKKAKKSKGSDDSCSSEDEQEEQEEEEEEEEEQEEEQETEPPPKPFKRLRRCATKDVPGEKGFPPKESGELPAAKGRKGKGKETKKDKVESTVVEKGPKTSREKAKVKDVKKTVKKAKAGDANKQKAKVPAASKAVKTTEAASSSHENAKKRKVNAVKVEDKRAKVEASKAGKKKEQEGQEDDKVIERKAQRSRKSSAYVAARKQALEEGLSEEIAKEKGRIVS